MRCFRVATLGVLVGTLATMVFFGACSLLYNPNDLTEPSPDAQPDARPVDPDLLKLTGLQAQGSALDEGVGDGHGRPALLVVAGTDIAANATITITRKGGGALPNLELRNPPVISKAGDLIAVPVAALVDPTLAAGASVELDVMISQPGNSGATIEAHAAWSLAGYGELDAAANLPTADAHTYSRVNVTGPVRATGTKPLIIRSNSSLSLTTALDVSGNGQAAGPGWP
jgi:hypothetical protein